MLVCALVLAPALTRGLGRLLTRWLGERAWPWMRPMPAKGLQHFLTMVKRPFLRGATPIRLTSMPAMPRPSRRWPSASRPLRTSGNPS